MLRRSLASTLMSWRIVGVFEHVKESFVSPCFNEGACNLVHILHRDAITEIGINDDSVVTTCDGALIMPSTSGRRILSIPGSRPIPGVF